MPTTAATWVLILILSGGASTDTSLRFTNEHSCERAAASLQQMGNAVFAYTSCLKMKDLQSR